MAELSYLPGALDLRIYRGDDANFQVTINDKATGEPLTLPTTGWVSQVRARATSESEVLFQITVDASAAATGVLTLSIDGADTADIAKKVVWDLENTDLERTYLAGYIYAEGQVTRV